MNGESAARLIAMTLDDAPGETTHWTGALIAKTAGVPVSSVQRIWRTHGLQPHRVRQFKLSNDPSFIDKLRDVVGLYVDPPAHAVVLRVTLLISSAFTNSTFRGCQASADFTVNTSALRFFSAPISLQKPSFFAIGIYLDHLSSMIYDRSKVLVQWADIRRGKMDMGPVSEISAKGDESSRNPSTATANLFEENTYRKVALRLLPLLVVCYIVAYLDRVNIGFAKLQMLADLGFSDTVYAFGASIFFWGYVLFEVPSNLVLHRVGARIWIARILVSWGIASAAIMFTAQIASAIGTSNDMVFYVLRFLLGVCEAGFFPGIVLYLTYWFPADRQTKALGLFVIALPLSLVIGGPVSGGLLHVTNGIMGLNGWQWMLLLEALPAVLLGGVVFLWLDDRPDKARWLTGAERDLVVSQLSVENVHKQHYVRDALKDFRVWTMMGVVFTYNTGFYGLSFWLPTILRDAGVADTFTIGLLTAIPYACGGVVMVLNSRHASRTREYRYHGVVPAVLGGLSLIASAYFAHNIPVSMVFLTISACGIMGLMPIVWSYPGRVLSDTAAAAGIGLINSVGSLSGITGAMISGLALSMTGSVNNGTYVLGLSLLVSAGLIFLVSSRRTSVQTRSALIPATPV